MCRNLIVKWQQTTTNNNKRLDNDRGMQYNKRATDVGYTEVLNGLS